MADQCSHKFTDTGYCVKCGDTLEAIKAAGYDEAMALIVQLRAELDRANGLWWYWRTTDISDTDDHWANFTNAVIAHLDGEPVDERFIASPPVRP